MAQKAYAQISTSKEDAYEPPADKSCVWCDKPYASGDVTEVYCIGRQRWMCSACTERIVKAAKRRRALTQ
jgi:hypothetical protein